jgi:hypothetical protein
MKMTDARQFGDGMTLKNEKFWLINEKRDFLVIWLVQRVGN